MFWTRRRRTSCRDCGLWIGDCGLEESAANAESASRDPTSDFNPQSAIDNPQSGARPDTSTHVIPRTYITSDLPPIGGVIKQRAEDFLVDEVPLYQPSGAGEHIYLLVQKRGLSTMEMVEIVAAHFAVPRRAVGYAGLKDKHAITRQVVSVHAPGRKIEDFGELRHEKISVLWAD